MLTEKMLTALYMALHTEIGHRKRLPARQLSPSCQSTADKLNSHEGPLCELQAG